MPDFLRLGGRAAVRDLIGRPGFAKPAAQADAGNRSDGGRGATLDKVAKIMRVLGSRSGSR